MSYKVKIKNEGTYLYASAEGKQTFEGNLELAQKVFEACVKVKTNSVLMDIRNLTGQPGTIADLKIADMIASMPDIRKMVEKVALLEDAKSVEEGKSFETFMRNRGLAVAVFTEKTEAAKWLKP